MKSRTERERKREKCVGRAREKLMEEREIWKNGGKLERKMFREKEE